MINIRKASQNDAALLTRLARDIYKEHYLHLWLPGGAEWYMEEAAYSWDKMEKDLADANVEYYIATEKGNPVGYLKLVLNAVLPGSETLFALEVERIYLKKETTGKGVGRQLMQFAMEKAKGLKKEIVFLKAMDSSTQAIEFYKKLGFNICGTLQLPMPEFSLMKEEFRGMVVMKKEVQ